MNEAPAVYAWRGLEQLRPDVERTLHRNCRDSSEVDDLVQETFLRAARFRRGLSDPACLRAWVLRIAWNVLRDHIRRERRISRADVSEDFLLDLEGRETPPGDPGPPQEIDIGDRAVDSDDLLAWLADLVEELPAAERALVDIYYHKERGCAGLGRHFGVPAQTVKMRLFRLRRRLRRALRRQVSLLPTGAAREVIA